MGGEDGLESVGDTVHQMGAGLSQAGQHQLESSDEASHLVASEQTLLTDDEDGAGVWAGPSCQLPGKLKENLSTLENER